MQEFTQKLLETHKEASKSYKTQSFESLKLCLVLFNIKFTLFFLLDINKIPDYNKRLGLFNMLIGLHQYLISNFHHSTIPVYFINYVAVILLINTQNP